MLQTKRPISGLHYRLQKQAGDGGAHCLLCAEPLNGTQDGLLGICFLRGVPEDVVGEIGEGEKGG